jgi:hypothetical protein
MRRLYVIVPGPALTVQLVDELIAEDIPREGIRLFAQTSGRLTDLPVSVRGFRPSRDLVLLRTLSGAILALLSALLIIIVGEVGDRPGFMLLTVTLAGAAIGAITAWWRDLPRELRRLRSELNEDDVVMLIDLPEARLGEVERQVESRYPEIRIKGTDPAGTPPFP